MHRSKKGLRGGSLKILYVIKGLGLGGAEQHLAQVAIAMQRRGHTVEVAYLLPGKSHLHAKLSSTGVRVSCWGAGGRLWWLALWRPMWRALHEFRPQVVHAHLPVPGMLMRLLKPLLGYRLIYTEHITWQLLHPATRWVHRLSWGLDDRAISCSRGVADSYPRESLVIDNGISGELPAPARPGLHELLGLPASALIWLCVANFRPQKNHPLLLRAFDQACADSQSPEWHLVLVGQDATERDRCVALAKTLASCQRIHFLGMHPDAGGLMPEAAGFCLSSREEGLPIALLEAMRAGLPAVVTAVGGMPDVIDAQTGRVVPSGATEAFAAALAELGRDPGLRHRLGTAAQARFHERYTETAMLNRLDELYAEVVR